jgi:two-component sensor histidine kinase
VSLTISPIRDGGGKVIGASKVARDITEQKKYEAERTLLLDELSHRVKNTLAIVQSIARQTLRDEARAGFEPRLRALAQIHDLLLSNNWTGASVREIAERALEPFAAPHSESYVLLGKDDLRVMPNVTALVMMTFHELATNAAKYGALSTPGGRVHVNWNVVKNSGKKKLTISWEESKGPQVVSPKSKGFGTRMIESGWEGLGGEVKLKFASGGLKCRLELALNEL